MKSLLILSMLFMAVTAFAQQEDNVPYKTTSSMAFSPGDRIVVGEAEVFESASGKDSLVFHFVPAIQEFIAQHSNELEFKLHAYFQEKLEKKLGEGRTMFIFSDIEDYLNSYTFDAEKERFRISSGQFHTVKKQPEHVLVELEVTKIR